MRLYYKIKDMKKVFLLAFVLFAWSMVVNAQESDGKYIEVTGSSEIEVVPDEIHFLIQIKEYWQEEYTGKSNKEEDFRTKVPLAMIEKDLRRSLRKIGIADDAIRTQEIGDYWRQRGKEFLIGGYALAIVVGWLTYNRASSLFVSYLTMLLATVYFSSLAFFVLEHRVNPLVNDYGDALWWAFMDVTTVGSNIIAQTVTGRVLSVLLAALGMMMFPIFTVYITNLIQQSNKRRKQYYEEEEQQKKASAQKESAEKAVVQKVNT